MESSVPKAIMFFIVAMFLLMGFLTTSEAAREGPMMQMKMMSEKEAHDAIDRLYNLKAFAGHGLGLGLGAGYGLHPYIVPVPVVTNGPVYTVPYYYYYYYGGPYTHYSESEAAVPKSGKVAHDQVQVDHKQAASP